MRHVDKAEWWHCLHAVDICMQYEVKWLLPQVRGHCHRLGGHTHKPKLVLNLHRHMEGLCRS